VVVVAVPVAEAVPDAEAVPVAEVLGEVVQDEAVPVAADRAVDRGSARATSSRT
jgi:hypothetical protein